MSNFADICNTAQFHTACELLLCIHRAESSDSLYREVRDFLQEYGYLED